MGGKLGRLGGKLPPCPPPVDETLIICSKKFSDNVSLQNDELLSASESGDVMTVVSLLNSGADVQTETKVVCTCTF